MDILKALVILASACAIGLAFVWANTRIMHRRR